MFRLENINKTYSRRNQQVLAFAVESLVIAQGDYVALVGPSGSGKTTLLSMLGGMLSPTAGGVWFSDVSLYDLSVTERAKLRREKIGFVFQTFNLIPYLNAIENVQIPLYLAGKHPTEQRERAAMLLQQVGLGDRLHHKPCELSTGQQQRVALARTLANKPSVILADEPTGNLDPDSRRVVLDFFDDLNREGCTIVMVTHDTIAAERAKQRLHLFNGTLVTDSTKNSRSAA